MKADTMGGTATPHASTSVEGFTPRARESAATRWPTGFDRRSDELTTPNEVPDSCDLTLLGRNPVESIAVDHAVTGLAIPEVAPASEFVSPYHNPFRTRLILADAIAVLSAAAISFAGWSWLGSAPLNVMLEHALLFVATFPVWLGTLMIARLYVARVVNQRAEEFRRIWSACAASTVAMVFLAFAVQYDTLSRGWTLALFISIGATLAIERAVARRLFARLRREGRISRPIAVIGSDPHALRLVETLQANKAFGYSVAGYISDDGGATDGDATWLGPVGRTEELLQRHGCTGAIVSLASITAADVNRLVRSLTDRGFHIALSSSLHDIDMTRVRPQSIDGRTLLYIEPVIRDGWRACAKQAFDVAMSTFAAACSAPVVLAAAALIKIDSTGPVFFRQQRVGRDGKPFEMLKLRTMQVDAEARLDEVLADNERDGTLFKSASDPRITRVGRLLRKWSIDEIPQFYNVIRGDMSIVGPRPALDREVAQWDEQTTERLRVMPGITGLWQVEGRGNESFDVYKRLDLTYVDNWSLLHDLRIVWRTIGAVVARRGAI